MVPALKKQFPNRIKLILSKNTQRNVKRTPQPININSSTRFLDILSKYSNVHDNTKGTDKQTTHSYGPTYEKIFKALEGRPNLTILENGLYSGSFLQVIHEYFPDAEIYGVDIDFSIYMFPKDNPKIHLYELDGTLRSTAELINQKFDLIIEDGSHLPEHQKQSLDSFAPYLKENGYYVTEDIDSRNIQMKQENGFYDTEDIDSRNKQSLTDLKQDLETIGKKHNLQMEWIDLTHIKNRFDDILAVFTPIH